MPVLIAEYIFSHRVSQNFEFQVSVGILKNECFKSTSEKLRLILL